MRWIFGPCSKGLAWRHVRWSYPRQSSSRACTAQLPAAAHMARTDARPTAAAGADRATRATSMRPAHVADFSQYCGRLQPLEPQRFPSRRRFPLSTPRIVASLMVAPASLAIRCFRPPVACDDRPATTLTADDVRVDDEAVPDPGVSPLALVTDEAARRAAIDLVEKSRPPQRPRIFAAAPRPDLASKASALSVRSRSSYM